MENESVRKGRLKLRWEPLVIGLLFTLIGSAWAQIIPASRTTTWQNNVGVEGGIPSRATQIDCTQSPYKVPTNGISDATNAMRSCLSGISSGQAAYLPAGTYVISGTITIPSNKTLRGAGMTSTIIQCNSNISNLIAIGGDNGAGPDINIISGYTKDSTQIVVSDASSISVGDYVLIDEINDATLPVTIAGTGGNCTFCSRNSGTRARGQVMKVTKKVSNTLTISPGLVWTFSSGNTPYLRKALNMTVFAGVENLTVKNGTGSISNMRTNILMMNSANSWAKNVKTDTCGYACVRLWAYNYRNEIRDSYFTDCLDHINSGTCYGVPLQSFTSSCLVENNAFYQTSDGIIISWGASGNVIAYNYLKDVHRQTNTDGWFWASTWNHGAHPGFNLFEGNDFVALNLDSYWGSGSHNTIFRNRILGRDPDISYNVSAVQNAAALQVQGLNNYENIVGNVLGVSDVGWLTTYEVDGSSSTSIPAGTRPIYGTGLGGTSYDSSHHSTLLRHMNYDYYNKGIKHCGDSGETGCQGGNGSTTLADSLYLASKPSWWCKESIWPPVDPVTGSYSDIPAKRRYDGNPCVAAGGLAPPQGLSISPTP